MYPSQPQMMHPYQPEASEQEEDSQQLELDGNSSYTDGASFASDSKHRERSSSHHQVDHVDEVDENESTQKALVDKRGQVLPVKKASTDCRRSLFPEQPSTYQPSGHVYFPQGHNGYP